MARKITLALTLLCSLVFVSCKDQAIKTLTKESYTPEFWAWSHANPDYTNQQWDSVFTKLEDAGFYGVLISADSNVLKRVLPLATQHQLKVQAWMWAMNRSDADSSWWSYNALGQSLAEKRAYVDYYKFMCPALPEVREFLQQKVHELTKIKGLYGIHLDYIRYVDVILPEALQPKYGLKQDHIMPEFDYGYHPEMRKLYKQRYGVDPLELDNYQSDSTWIRFRLDELNKTVNLLPPIAHEAGMQLTAAVFPTPAMSRDMVRQDWESWQLDCFYPMTYFKFYNEDHQWAKLVTDTNIRSVRADRTVCGLYLPDITDSTDFSRAIHHILESKPKGISIFELRGLNESHYNTVKKINNKRS